MEIKELIQQNVLVPLLSTVTTVLATFLISWVLTGSLTSLFKEIPLYVYAIFLLLMVILVTIKKQCNKIKLYDSRDGTVEIGVPVYGWKTWLDRYPYKHVSWRVQLPSVPPWGSSYYDHSIEDIHVSIPPKCPICETELEQVVHFCAIYYWKCIHCGFKYRSKDHWYLVAERVKREVKGELERKKKIW